MVPTNLQAVIVVDMFDRSGAVAPTLRGVCVCRQQQMVLLACLVIASTVQYSDEAMAMAVTFAFACFTLSPQKNPSSEDPQNTSRVPRHVNCSLKSVVVQYDVDTMPHKIYITGIGISAKSSKLSVD
jgi:hypothetical protein